MLENEYLHRDKDEQFASFGVANVALFKRRDHFLLPISATFLSIRSITAGSSLRFENTRGGEVVVAFLGFGEGLCRIFFNFSRSVYIY